MLYWGYDIHTHSRLSQCPFLCHTARRVNLPPTAVISPQMQVLTLPLTSAFIDGSHGYLGQVRVSPPRGPRGLSVLLVEAGRPRTPVWIRERLPHGACSSQPFRCLVTAFVSCVSHLSVETSSGPSHWIWN